MNAINHISDYLESLSSAVKRIRFFSLVVGAGLTVVGQSFRGSEIEWQAEHAATIFWVGLAILLLTNFVLVFIDKQAIETLRSLHEEEAKTKELSEEVEVLSNNDRALTAWITLTKLLSELLDQAILATKVDKQASERIYAAAVEFIAEYKTRLFDIQDDYLNISIYEYVTDSKELECVACYRTRLSDAKGPHRSWRVGEGHIGKAFELQTELVCADARAPDVSAWVAAPPEKFRDEDEERYVSLAAIPIAIDAEQPLGVIIMTSNEPYRFVNHNDADDGAVAQRGKYAVAALQDIAAQIAQIMCILQKKRTNQEEDTDDRATGKDDRT